MLRRQEKLIYYSLSESMLYVLWNYLRILSEEELVGSAGLLRPLEMSAVWLCGAWCRVRPGFALHTGPLGLRPGAEGFI